MIDDKQETKRKVDKGNSKKAGKGLTCKKISAIVSSVLAVIGAIAVLINNYNTIYGFLLGKKEDGKHIVVPPPASDEGIQACKNLKVKTFKVFPYYLVNSYNKAPEDGYMYWAAISGKNPCDQPLLIRIWFTPHQNAKVEKEQIDTRVGPREEIVEKKGRKNPLLKIQAKTDDDVIINGGWKIFDVSKGVPSLCNQDPFCIRVIKENHVYWDLRNPDNHPADIGFLLASLSAWSILPKNPHQELKNRASSYYRLGNDPEKWLRACYNDLFHSTTPVQVHRYADQWPLRGEEMKSIQRIRTWEMVLKEKKADSLEAAMFIAAIKNAMSTLNDDLKFRLVLFALPLDPVKDEGEKRFLLAWAPKKSERRAVDPKEWQAVDLTNPNELDFEQNVRQTSTVLSQVLQTQGEKIFTLLNKQGVFYDQTKPLALQPLLGVDFHLASAHYYIAGLRDE